MVRTNRTAFTLVELLVVIAIISMLVALLVPAVIGARERARRTSCMNRMDQAAKAIIQYETAKGELPGYVNLLGGGTLGGSSVAGNNNLSWVVVVLENLGRADLWKEWRAKKSDESNRVSVELPEVLCPSDFNKRGVAGALSFVVNCGISDNEISPNHTTSYEAVAGKTTYEESAWGLFYDHDPSKPFGLPGSATKTVTIGLDGISDGAQQTLLLSENKDATSWFSREVSPASSPVYQRSVGFVWWSTVGSLPWASSVPAQVAVNSTTADKYFKARPSSNHPGGVNAIYADGHADFISDQVDYLVFRNQMTSNATKAKPLAP